MPSSFKSISKQATSILLVSHPCVMRLSPYLPYLGNVIDPREERKDLEDTAGSLTCFIFNSVYMSVQLCFQVKHEKESYIRGYSLKIFYDC